MQPPTVAESPIIMSTSPALNRTQAAEVTAVSTKFLREQEQADTDAGRSLYVPRYGYPTGQTRLVVYHPEQVRLWQAVAWGNMTRDDAEAAWQTIRGTIGSKTPQVKRRPRRRRPTATPAG